MGNDEATKPLSAYLRELCLELAALYDFAPSKWFVDRIKQFAESVGPRNYADLMALVTCDVADWYERQGRGEQLFQREFLSHTCLNWYRHYAERTDKVMEAKVAEDAIGHTHEGELRKLFLIFLEQHPEARRFREELCPEDLVKENAVIRAVDRIRQRWRREAVRERQQRGLPSYPSRDIADPATTLIEAEDAEYRAKVVHLIAEAVGIELDSDEQIIFRLRFEEGRSYRDLRRHFNYRYSADALKMRAYRLRAVIRDHVNKRLIELRLPLFFHES